MPRKKASPNRQDGRYEVKITIGKTLQGKLIRKSFYSEISKADAKKKADAWIIEQKVSELTGVSSAPAQTSYTFERWAMTWLKNHKEKAVRRITYEETYQATVTRYLIPHFGKANLSDILPSDIVAFYNDINARYSNSLLEKCKICLNGIFESAIDDGVIFKNPAKKAKLPALETQAEYSEIRALSMEEEKLVREFCLEHRFGLEVLIMLELGLRRGELCALRWDDIGFDTLSVSIHSTASYTKSGGLEVGLTKTRNSTRILPISPEFASYLWQHRGSGYIVGGTTPIIPHTWGEKHLNKFWDDFCKEHPGAATDTARELRHTCGTRLYAKTKDIYAVSKFLGHSSVEITTRYYIKTDVSSLRESLQIGNNCRQSVVSGSKGTNTHSDIFSPFSESASKESYNHAVL